MTCTRLEADARSTDADEGEAIVDVDVVGVSTRRRFTVEVYWCCGTSLFDILGRHSTLKKHTNIPQSKKEVINVHRLSLVAVG